MRKFQVILALVCLVLLAVVGLQNSDVIALQFLFWQTSVSLLALVILIAAAGVAIGLALGMFLSRRRATGSRTGTF